MKSIKSFSFLSISFLYIIASIFIGPGIVFYALGRGRTGMDCSDMTWDGVSASIKNNYYHDAATIMRVGSLSMLTIGALLLITVVIKARGREKFVYGFLIATMMAGYLIILASANTWFC